MELKALSAPPDETRPQRKPLRRAPVVTVATGLPRGRWERQLLGLSCLLTATHTTEGPASLGLPSHPLPSAAGLSLHSRGRLSNLKSGVTLLPAASAPGAQQQGVHRVSGERGLHPTGRAVRPGLGDLERGGERTEEGESGSQHFTFQSQQVLLFGGVHFHFDQHSPPRAYGG